MTELTTRIEAVERVITEWAGPYKTGEGMTDDECLRRIRAIIEGDARSTPAEALAHKIADRMAQAYNLSMARAADVAKACDESIDPTGNLLGWLREYARLRSPESDR